MIKDIDDGPVRLSREEEAARAATVQSKESVRQTLERELEEFLARGGKVQEVGIIKRDPEELTAVRVESHKREAAEARKLPPAERDARRQASAVMAAEVASKPARLQKIAEAAARKAAQPKPALPTPAAADPAPKPTPEKKPMNVNPNMDPPPVAQKKPEAPNFDGKLTTALASVFKPAVMPHTESPMERVRDVLFREIELVQSGQSTFEQTARVLDLIDKIEKTYQLERELVAATTPSITIQPTKQQAQKLKAALSAPAVTAKKQSTRGNTNPKWSAREEINELMQRRGITGADVVRGVGGGLLNRSTISNYLKGHNNPRPHVAEAIERYVRQRASA